MVAITGMRNQPHVNNVIQIAKSCPIDLQRKISDPAIPFEDRWELILQWGIFTLVGGQIIEYR